MYQKEKEKIKKSKQKWEKEKAFYNYYGIIQMGKYVSREKILIKKCFKKWEIK